MSLINHEMPVPAEVHLLGRMTVRPDAKMRPRCDNAPTFSVHNTTASLCGISNAVLRLFKRLGVSQPSYGAKVRQNIVGFRPPNCSWASMGSLI